MVRQVNVKGVVNSADNNQAYIVTDDIKSCYVIQNPNAPDDYFPSCVEWVDSNKIDYNYLPTDKHKKYDNTLIKHHGLPLSYLQIDNVEDGAQWYKENTKYPDLVCDMLARYEWGDLRFTTPKEFKNMKKKRERRKRPVQKLQVNKGPIVVKFD